jgi:excisionase family DNA binding protein
MVRGATMPANPSNRTPGDRGAVLARDIWLTTQECAHELGVSPWYVRERIEDGSLPAIAIEGRRTRYRVHRTDLEKYRDRFVRQVWEWSEGAT